MESHYSWQQNTYTYEKKKDKDKKLVSLTLAE